MIEESSEVPGQGTSNPSAMDETHPDNSTPSHESGALQEDGDWHTVKRTRKRKVSGTATLDQATNSATNSIKTKLSPPIVFPVPKNWGDLACEIQSLVQGPISVSLRGNNYALRTEIAEDFQQVSHFLKSKNVEFHTFSAVERTELKVVIKGLHHSHDPSDIATTLSKAGFQVTLVKNLTGRSGHPLNIFLIKLVRQPGVEKIYSLNHLFLTNVTVEAFKPKPGLPQCYRCQNYGHSSVNCSRKLRCVKCGNPHDSKECTAVDFVSTKPVCCNCNGQHTANYRGCSLHKKLLKRNNVPKSSPIPSKTAGVTVATPQVNGSQEQRAGNATPATPLKVARNQPPPPQPSTSRTVTKTKVVNRPVYDTTPSYPTLPKEAPPPSRPVFTPEEFPPLPQRKPTTTDNNPSPQEGLLSLLTSPKIITFLSNLLPLLLTARSIQDLVTALMNALPSLLS